MFNNFDPNDPRTAGLMQLAAALMGNKGGNFGQALGQAIPQGLMAYQGAQQNKMRSQEEEQQRKMRELQMSQMQRQADEQTQMRGLAERSFGPNPNLVAGDDQGNPMPQAPGGGGMPEYARGLMSINPQLGAQFMPRPQGPVALSAGARLVDPASGREVASNPKPEGPQKGQLREVKTGGKLFTYEWDGGKWNKIADAPQFKPDAPEKPDNISKARRPK